MALVNTKKMFEMAYKNGYAIGAFNVNNMEITQGIIDNVSRETLAFGPVNFLQEEKYARLEYLNYLVDAVLETNVRMSNL